MNNLYIHPSPTQFSLYTTEKPERFKTAAEGVKVNDEFMEKVIKEWRKDSHLAYLQEPEWKVGDKIYDKRGYCVGHFIGFGKSGRLKTKGYGIATTISHNPNTHSHYCPGQKAKASQVSYVREVFKFKSKPPHYGDLIGEWQPAPEPEKPTEDKKCYETSGIMKAVFESWQSRHAQWLTDLSEGKVQAVVNNKT